MSFKCRNNWFWVIFLYSFCYYLTPTDIVWDHCFTIQCLPFDHLPWFSVLSS